ncbi:MAG: tRNA-dihydrouridine synthase [Salinirussus sp.]
MSVPFEPPVALSSLSGESDADWARAGADHAGAAFLGGIAIDSPTRAAARSMVDRDRSEFLPPDPLAFVADQFEALEDAPIRPGINVRTTSIGPLRAMAELCREHGAILEINAHCRQGEMCDAGAGESLLRDGDRLCEQVRAAAAEGPTVGVKLRTEVAGVNLPALAARLGRAGADLLHVDAMDSERVVADVVERIEAVDDTPGTDDVAVIANNGVRGTRTVETYLRYGADAVSVGRPSTDAETLAAVRQATEAYRERPRLEVW